MKYFLVLCALIFIGCEEYNGIKVSECPQCPDVQACVEKEEGISCPSCPECPECPDVQAGVEKEEGIKCPSCPSCPPCPIIVEKEEGPSCPPCPIIVEKEEGISCPPCPIIVEKEEGINCPSCPQCPKCPDVQACVEKEEGVKCPSCPPCPSCPECPIIVEVEKPQTLYAYIDDDWVDQLEASEVRLTHFVNDEFYEENIASIVEVNGTKYTKNKITMPKFKGEIIHHVLRVEFDQIK